MQSIDAGERVAMALYKLSLVPNTGWWVKLLNKAIVHVCEKLMSRYTKLPDMAEEQQIVHRVLKMYGRFPSRFFLQQTGIRTL